MVRMPSDVPMVSVDGSHRSMAAPRPPHSVHTRPPASPMVSRAPFTSSTCGRCCAGSARWKLEAFRPALFFEISSEVPGSAAPCRDGARFQSEGGGGGARRVWDLLRRCRWTAAGFRRAPPRRRVVFRAEGRRFNLLRHQFPLPLRDRAVVG
jgi:hypothetical protein